MSYIKNVIKSLLLIHMSGVLPEEGQYIRQQSVLLTSLTHMPPANLIHRFLSINIDSVLLLAMLTCRPV
jgi:hypothetical protein